MEIIKKYIAYIVLVILSIGFLFHLNLPLINSFFSTQSDIKEKKESISDLEKSVEIAKKNKIEAQAKGPLEEKLIYEPEIKSTDTMVSFNGMLETVLELSKQSGVKVKTIEFKNIPESDPIKQNHSSTHAATLLETQLIGTYTQLQNLLRDIYRHKYLMGINSLKVVPYINDKKLLIIDLAISLYAKK